MRAHDILVGVNLLSARAEVDTASISGYARGVKGFWLLLAAAVDSRITKIWLDRTPSSMATAFENPLTSYLFDVMIPGFALHWEIGDLVQALGARQLLWTDPTNWMNQVVLAGPKYRYRYAGEKDDLYVEDFFR